MNKLTCSDIKVTYVLKKKEMVDGLNGLSISFSTGKINILLGENGCGKTTLFNCIVGLLPYDGTITIDDVDMDTITIKDRQIAYIQQNLTLYPRMTIFDNIAFPLKNLKYSTKDIVEKVYKITKEFGIAHLINCLPNQISIGQFQKVLLAKALVIEPKIIIMDEAFSNIDEMTTKFIQSKIREYTIKNEAITICVDHQLDEAIAFGDKFYVINNSQILLECDKTKDIKSKIESALTNG